MQKEPIRGRGATGNPVNRFASKTIEHDECFDERTGEWLDERATDPGEAPVIATQVIPEYAKTIISTNQSPDIPFDQSINPYRGCEHGCIYCYARPTHAYWDLSPGLDFETKIIAKQNAAEVLSRSLDKKGYQCKVITIGANTDPYQPLEAKLKITRAILEVLHKHQHPFSIITKSTMVQRDIDILSDMASKRLCSVAISVTTLDNDLKRKLEPRTANGEARLKTIQRLTNAGVPVSLMCAPVIPVINDHEIEQILDAGKAAGAVSAAMILVRLPLEVSPLFRDWLTTHYPDKASHVMSLIQQSRSGRDYESGFFDRMKGKGVHASMIQQRFKVAAKRLGLEQGRAFKLDTSLFRQSVTQLDLF